MKCEQCGGPITLEEEFCPYCGALNQAARQHLEDMKHYQNEYESTRSEVLGNAARQGTRHARLMAILALIALNVFVFVLQAKAYDIGYFIEEKSARLKASSYEEKMAELEVDGNYKDMYEYYDRHYLYSASDELQSYQSVVSMSYAYQRFMRYVYYLDNDKAKSYTPRNTALEYTASSACDFYDRWNEQNREYYRQEEFSGSHLKAMQDMKDKIETTLKTYCHLTDEDIEKLPETDKQSLLILIGRRMGIYE